MDLTQTCFCWRGQISKPIIGQITILKDSEHRNYNIPEELVVNILGRLPLKDIFRSKVVCKSWLKLISGPYFRSNYVRNSPFTLIFRAQYKYRNPNSKKLLLSFSLLEFAGGKGGGGEHTHNIPLLSPKKLPDRTNSCMSLIGGGARAMAPFSYCIPNASTLLLFSSNGRCKGFTCLTLFRIVVKIVSDDTRAGEVEPSWLYKVGFIPSNNTYKLVRFNHDSFFLDKPEILTVGLDENWRKLDGFGRLGCVGGAFGLTCFNGAYHWLLFGETDADEISTFDLLEEKTTSGGIPLPRGVSRLKSRLTILNDRLFVAETNRLSARMVIWTMGEYGVAASWSRFIVLMLGGPDDIEEIGRRDDWNLVPIAVLPNGDILFAHTFRGGMCFYNLQEKRLKQNFYTPPVSAKYRVDYDNTYVPPFH